ncbi:MAG: aminoacyl-tRNA hydrolase [Bacteroidales bacterium]|nr:aminoacyl-tRNA hydrolase [Bacteroidales bacterium]
MKYLIAGLGNPGIKYQQTRHNIGFIVLEAWAKASNVLFNVNRYAEIAEISIKSHRIFLIKPTTYMNLSGNAVRYWLQKENILLENMLVVVDDIALPFGTIRIRPKGSNGGHNGLAHIDEVLQTNEYARLRFGIGNNYPHGKQADYVLSPFTDDELKILPYYTQRCIQAIEAFILTGIDRCMNEYNKPWKPDNLS